MNDATCVGVSRILVIDDNQAIHQDFRKIFGASRERSTPSVAELALFGGADFTDVPEFQIDSAYQGEEGLALVRVALEQQSPYAMAFVDVRMPPGWDGIETTARIWQHDSDIQIVICTAYSDYTWSEMLAKLGRSDRLVILKKPFDTIEVVQLASALTEKWRLVRQSRSMLKDLERRVAERTRELAQAGEQMEASEAQYRLLFDSNPHPMWVYDMETLRFVTVNGAAVRHYGYTEQQFLGMTIDRIRPVEDVAMLAQNVDELQGQGKSFGVWRHSKQDGSTIDVEVSSDRIMFEGRPARLVLAHDVTERRQIEEEIHETKNFLASIFDNIPNSIFVKDARELRFVRVNAACEKLTGYAEKEFVGKSDHDFFPKDQADFFVAKDRETLAGKQRVFIVEETITSKDGTQKILRTKKFPILDKDGNPQYLLGMSEDITERNQAQEMLRKSEARFRGFVEQSPDAMIIHQAGRIVFANDAMVRLLRAGDTGTLLGKPGLSLVHPEHVDIGEQRRARLYSGQTVPLIDQVYLRLDGTSVEVEVSSAPIVLDGEPAALVTVREITERKEQERKIARLNRIHAVLSSINSVIVRIRDPQELFEEACRIAVDQGRLSMAWIGLVDRDALKVKPVASAGAEQGLLAIIEPRLSLGEAGSPRGITAMAVADKRPVVVNDVAHDSRVASLVKEHRARAIGSLAVLPLLVSGEAAGVLALHAEAPGFFDDEEMKLLIELAADIAFSMDHIAKEEKLNYLAYYDVLTGLANRSLFLDRVAQYMHSAVSGGHKLALFLIDLERFKNINDSLGWPAGDALLRQVAAWLTHNVGDVNLLARVDADHFAAVLPEVGQEADVARLLEKSMAALVEHPFHLNEAVFRIAVRVGVALFPDDGADADTLYKNAEAALKKTKSSGDRYLFYTQNMTRTMAGTLTLENQLRRALDNEEFVLHYQPKVNLASGQLTGAEALIRWNDPHVGLVQPGRFIPILEETGLIYEVGRWALRKAIEDYLRWRNAGLGAVRIAVNVSPLQLRHRGFIAEIEQAIGIDAHAAVGLELEITENLIMKDVEHNIASLQAIRAMGISIAIDDFGTGFSSLSYLSKLPVDTLKIDRSFVIDMTVGQQGLALVSAIISLAHSLKLKVVAEGVETAEQSRLLLLQNCDEMQGYLFSKPVPAEIFETRFLATFPSGGEK